MLFWDVFFVVGVAFILVGYLRSWAIKLDRNGVPQDEEDKW